MKTQLILCLSLIVATVSAWESWWRVEGTKFRFDEMFRWNLKTQRNLENNGKKKKELIEFLRFNKAALVDLSIHNKKTDFHPKNKENRVIIPYITHIVHVTKPDEPTVMERENIWEMVETLGQDVSEGVEWKHIFWTNDKSTIIINATACGGRCEIRTFNEIPGFQEVEPLVDQMLKSNMLILDVLKPMILYHFGGVYLHKTFNLERSFRSLHRVMDSYMGFEGHTWPGIASGVIATRPKHQAMEEWRDFILSYYGYREDVYGTKDIMPMPTFRQDIISTSGPRGLTFAVFNNLNKWGNNDAIFKVSMISLDLSHGAYQHQTNIGDIIDDNPMKEILNIGGKEVLYERFGHYRFERQYGYRLKTGEWAMPNATTWKMENGNEEGQYWVVDLSDRENILSPNYVTKDTIKDFRRKYNGKPMVQKMLYDQWFVEYFKTYDGSYADRLLAIDTKNEEEASIKKDQFKDEL